MSVEIPDVRLPNRAVRRRQVRRNQDPNIVRFISAVGQTDRGVVSFANEWNAGVSQFSNLTERVFQDPIDIYRSLEVLRRIPQLLVDIQANPSITVSSITLNNFQNNNFYQREINGLSFQDIEGMEAPLSTENIKRVNQMLKLYQWQRKFQHRPSSNETVAVHLMIFAACQQFARPDRKLSIPEQVKPFHEAVISYLDYYTHFVVNPPNDLFVEASFMLNLQRSGYGLFPALCSFVPARLGITSSSVIKLFEERTLKSPMRTDTVTNRVLNRGLWTPLIKDLRKFTPFAHRKDNLLPDLAKFQYYSPEADEAASDAIRTHYGHDIDIEESRGAILSFKERWGRYREATHSDLIHLREKRLVLSMPDEHLVSSVTVTAQNKDTIILILHFRDSSTHLTLEIGKDGRLYGFPSSLVDRRPELADELLSDITTPLLDRVRVMHPSIEPIRSRQSQEEVGGVIVLPQPVPVTAEPEYVPRQKIEKPRKPSILTPIQAYLLQRNAQPPGIEPKAKEPKKKYRLAIGLNLAPRAGEIEDYLATVANKLAHNDRRRMLNDIKTMVKVLLEDPYSGSYKITDYKPYRSFRAEQRIELEREESNQLRVVFYFTGSEKNVVVLDDILLHDDFDKRFK